MANMDVRSLSVRFTVTALVVSLISTAVLAQDPQVAAWQRNAWRIEGLAVMIDRGPKTACSGAGIIAGYDAGRVYVLTAEHVIAGDTTAGIGVTARLSRRRVPTLENPAEERRFEARVTQRDAAMDLALLAIADAELADDVRLNSALNSLGDSSAARATDQTVIVGCGSGFGWDSPAQAVPVLAPDTGVEIYFAGGYVRKGFSGGPLVKVAGVIGFPEIIGLTLGVGEGQRGRAARIDTVLARAREWKVPIRLSAGNNDPSCTYTVIPKDVVIPSPEGSVKVSVRTGPECPWSVSAPTANYNPLLDVSVPEDRANRWRVHFGPFDVIIARSITAPCRQRRYDVVVAGQIVRVTDSACAQ